MGVTRTTWTLTQQVFVPKKDSEQLRLLSAFSRECMCVCVCQLIRHSINPDLFRPRTSLKVALDSPMVDCSKRLLVNISPEISHGRSEIQACDVNSFGTGNTMQSN